MTTGISSNVPAPRPRVSTTEPVVGSPGTTSTGTVASVTSGALQSAFTGTSTLGTTALTGDESTHLPSPGDVFGGAVAPSLVAGPGGLTFDSLTATGSKIMAAAEQWMTTQSKSPHFPKPRMCAQNVDKVLQNAGITRYKDEGVRNLVAHVKQTGGVVQAFPTDKAGFIAKLNSFYGGHLPAGTLVAGESKTSSNPGDQHVGFIGNVDPDGTVWIYHNNWYRPENEGGVRKPYMVSAENLAKGMPRQFMATPWIKLTRDATGKIVDVKSLMPAIDDMDPLNPSYGATLAVPVELAHELNARPSVPQPVAPSTSPAPATVGPAELFSTPTELTRPLAGITRPPATATEAERFAYWSSVVKAGGGEVNPHGMPTVLGVRGLAADGSVHGTTVNRDYGDSFVILRADGKVFEFSGSTHPGNETGPGVPALGVGLLRPGNYVAQPHGQRFGADSFAITTQRGSGAVPGVRDTDHDGTFSAEETSASEARGDTMTSVLFHQNSAYSVGCQTFDPHSWSRFVQALGGAKKSFSYTLVEAAQP